MVVAFRDDLSGRVRGMTTIGTPVGAAQDNDELLTPSEVAKLFRVDPKTVTRWAKAGKLSSIRTLGGHRRYRAGEVRELLDAQRTETDER
jgi:excisionase family DNA binding protein